MDVVIVESPAKAKTINKYLGRDFVVLATFGHVRDLPSREGSVEPDKDFAMHYATEPRSAKHMKSIADAIKGANRLFLATDPDREGEAISWHVLEVLKERRALKQIAVKRVVFHEITRSAVLEAMKHPRDLDLDLINAQQARRALDYLVGFTLSPILWRKLPGARSAGRVQSVALRLICERELAIEAFRPREFWTVEVDFAAGDTAFTARLVEVDRAKLDKFDLPDAVAAHAIAKRIAAGDFHVADVATKPARRNPAPPFTTSTLQQEAARKLGFTAQRTMDTAQRLYEGVDIGGETVGLITYMRTDGVTLANEAVKTARDVIAADFGKEYVPPSARFYKAKTRNAQEAHEAIRPTDFSLRPPRAARYLDDGQRKLYELIWNRAVACQMESAEIERTTVDIADVGGAIGLRASGTVTIFPGFLKIYEEGHDDNGKAEEAARLPKLKTGDKLAREKVKPEQHFTEPPPRFGEASLVKKLEELGIGRPSTYASILGVLRDRNYVTLEKNRFVPQDKGRIVTAFLIGFFEHYFAYDFTANLEDKLDEITEHRADWKDVLRAFWLDFSRPAFARPAAYSAEAAASAAKAGSAGEARPPATPGVVSAAADKLVSVAEAVANLDQGIGKRSVVIAAIDEALGPHFFPETDASVDPRRCPACGNGRQGIKLGKNGAFIGCTNYPECRYTRPLALNGDGADHALAAAEGPKTLGVDPASGLAVSLRVGPYGPYVQIGETPTPQAKGMSKIKSEDKSKEKPAAKPKRAALPKGVELDKIDLAAALKLLSLPRTIGAHPETGQPILAGLGPFGPYLKHDGRYARLASAEEALDMGLNRAVAVIAEAALKGPGRRRTVEPLRGLGPHPVDGQPVMVMPGRYGPYLKHGKTNAPIPRGVTPEEITLAAAVEAIAIRAAAGPARAGGRRKPKKATAPRKTKAPTKAEAAE